MTDLVELDQLLHQHLPNTTSGDRIAAATALQHLITTHTQQLQNRMRAFIDELCPHPSDDCTCYIHGAYRALVTHPDGRTTP